MANGNEIWGKRLREARIAAKLSQKELGIQAGLDEFVASTRINRYELGIHKADYQIAQRLALVLNVPVSYLYTDEDSLAQLSVLYHRVSNKNKSEILKFSLSLHAGSHFEE